MDFTNDESTTAKCKMCEEYEKRKRAFLQAPYWWSQTAGKEFLNTTVASGMLWVLTFCERI